MRPEALEIRELCERVGYGNVMATASDLWRKIPTMVAPRGGAFMVGPCEGFCQPCRHPDSDRGAVGCDWCEGCGWVTNLVANLQRKEAKPKGGS